MEEEFSKQLVEELKALAERLNVTIDMSCHYCGHGGHDMGDIDVESIICTFSFSQQKTRLDS